MPGFAGEQISPDFQEAIPLQLNADGTFKGDANNQWTDDAPWLELNWNNAFLDKVIIEQGRDWENKRPCLVFTGLNNIGMAIWGTKNRILIDSDTSIDRTYN